MSGVCRDDTDLCCVLERSEISAKSRFAQSLNKSREVGKEKRKRSLAGGCEMERKERMLNCSVN
jgi:hypothetical protein